MVNPYTNCRSISITNIHVTADGGKGRNASVKTVVPSRPAMNTLRLPKRIASPFENRIADDGGEGPEHVEGAEQALAADVVLEVVEDDAAAHRERDEEHERQREHREPRAVSPEIREVLRRGGGLIRGGPDALARRRERDDEQHDGQRGEDADRVLVADGAVSLPEAGSPSAARGPG